MDDEKQEGQSGAEKHPDRARQIELLQDNLQIFRKLAGLTVTQLSDRLDVTRQTICNLESKKTKMSFVQYIALRTVFDCEIRDNGENKVLGDAIHLLLDCGEELSEEQYRELRSSLETVAAAASGGMERARLPAVFTGVLGATAVGAGLLLGGPLLVGGLMAGGWIGKLLSDTERKGGPTE